MITIKLSKSWLVEDDKSLGPGGFGTVFCGKSEEGDEVAVKLFHANRIESAARELSLAEHIRTEAYSHVIPILDFGRDEYTGAYVIVMARASRSLQQFVIDTAPVAEDEALDILDNIAQGLQEIGGIIHRDLKPANILEHDGIWKIADLGLARFLDASTSAHTMKDFLSAPYAAPELWRGERPTKAVDVYALGCITYALLTGHPPFDGPEKEDYKRQHELTAPPELPASARLKQLTARSLAKAPELRPPIDSYRIQLTHIKSSKNSTKTAALSEAAAVLARRRAREEALELDTRRKKEERARISAEAASHATEILKGLIDLIRTEAPEAELEKDKSHANFLGSEKLGLVLHLGDALLIGDLVDPAVKEGVFGRTWNIYCLAKIEVVSGWSSHPGRSANLAFGSVTNDAQLAWWELGFTFGKLEDKYRDNHPYPPFSLGGGHSSSGYRWGGTDGQWDHALKYYYRLAYNPRRIDGEHLGSFYQKWIDLFSRVAIAEWGNVELPAFAEEPIEEKYRISL